VRLLAMMILIGTAGTAAADEPKKDSKAPVKEKELEPLPPLYSIELRFGKGIEMGGSGEMTTTRGTPLNVSAIVAIAINESPWINAYGGMSAEIVDRNAVGAVAGVQLPVRGTGIRVSAGGTYMFSPFTLWGASAAVGGCTRGKFGQLGLCGDVELTSFFAGTDLADGKMVTQIQVRMGVTFDAL
jgi:hypothetical protein